MVSQIGEASACQIALRSGIYLYIDVYIHICIYIYMCIYIHTYFVLLLFGSLCLSLPVSLSLTLCGDCESITIMNFLLHVLVLLC